MVRRTIALLLALVLLAAGAAHAETLEYDAPDASGGFMTLSSQEMKFSTLTDVMVYLDGCAQRQETSISFSYSESLDSIFATPDALWAILKHCGMVDWEQTRWTEKRRVTIENAEYRQGYKIAQAYLTGDYSGLNNLERATCQIAMDIVQEALANTETELELQRYLHDAICARTVYTDGGENESWTKEDTAVGALYHGVAECDGYSDAFYLLGTMAGLTVVYQTGDALEWDTGEYTSHMWNLIYLNGGWHHVDVTWDDMDYEADPYMNRYRYFNVGSDMLDDHQWEENYSFCYPARYTDWNVFFYSCLQAGETGLGAYYDRNDWAAQYVINRKNEGARSAHVMVDGGDYENAKEFNTLLRDMGLKGKWTTWTRNMDRFTCFDVLFVE